MTSTATAAEVLAAYREHVRLGDTISIGVLADEAGVARSSFMAALPALGRHDHVRIERAGRHPNDVYLTVNR